jgi:hypothetical protein
MMASAYSYSPVTLHDDVILDKQKATSSRP